MATVVHPVHIAALLPTLIVLLKTMVDAAINDDDGLSQSDDSFPRTTVGRVDRAMVEMNTILASVLHDFRVAHANSILDDELGYWVKPRSTTWFSQFLLHEYDDDRWVENFRFTKSAVFSIANLLRPRIERQNTKYRKAIPVRIRVACTLYKLCQGVSFLVCSEMFAIGKSTVCGVIRDVVRALNIDLRQKISFPRGQRLVEVMEGFQATCNLPGIAGAIDGTHIHIRKPSVAPEDYFYFKSGGFSIQCQAVVDSSKRFLDVVVGMPGSTHDTRMLRRSSLYRQAEANSLFDGQCTMEGFTPYLIGDKGYPLKSWLMTPHRDTVGGNLSVLQRLFNHRLSRGRSVVENAFGIMKQSFRELLHVSDLHVTFLPDVVICCALLHNVLLGQDPDDVGRLLAILEREGFVPEVHERVEDPALRGAPPLEFDRADSKRVALGEFLGHVCNVV